MGHPNQPHPGVAHLNPFQLDINHNQTPAYKKLHGSPLANFTNTETSSEAADLPTNSVFEAAVVITLDNCNVCSSWPVGSNPSAVPFTAILPSAAHVSPVTVKVPSVVPVSGLTFTTAANVPSNVASSKTPTVARDVVVSEHGATAEQPLNTRDDAPPLLGDVITGDIALSVLPLQFMVRAQPSRQAGGPSYQAHSSRTGSAGWCVG